MCCCLLYFTRFAGLLLRIIGKWQHLDEQHHKGMTIIKLALSVGSLASGMGDVKITIPVDAFFDDNLFFEVHEDNDDGGGDKEEKQAVIVTDSAGVQHKFERKM